MTDIGRLLDLMDRVQRLGAEVADAISHEIAQPLAEDQSPLSPEQQHARQERDQRRREQVRTAYKKISSWQAAMGT